MALKNLLTMRQSNEMTNIEYSQKDSFNREVKPFLTAQAIHTVEVLCPIAFEAGRKEGMKRPHE